MNHRKKDISKLYRYWRKRMNMSDNEFIQNIREWDWRALSVCFITAFTFWIFHALNAEHTTSIHVPLSVEYENEQIVALRTPPNHLTVNVTGNGWALITKSFPGGNTLNLELNDPVRTSYVPGKTLLEEINQLLKNMKVNYIVEDTIFFNYDELVSRPIVMRVNKDSLPLGEGYEAVSHIYINPDTVTFTGPQSYVQTLPNHLYLDLHDFEPIEESFDEVVKVNFLKKDHLSVDYKEVNVTFEVAYILHQKLPVKLKLVDFPEHIKPSINTSDVYVSYDIKEYDVMEELDTVTVWLEFKDLNLADSTVKSQVVLDKKYMNVKVHPERVKVKFQ